jgi:hypothetical protein
MSDASRRSALGVLASGVVHAAVVLGMHQQGKASERAPEQPLWLELQIEPREPAPSAAQESAPAVQDRLPEAPQRAPSRRRERAPEQRPRELAPEESERTEVALPVAEQPAQATSGGPQPPKLDLSPLAAARTLDDSTYAVRDAGTPARDEQPRSPQAHADALAQQVPGLHPSKGSGRSARRAVDDTAEDVVYNGLRPWKLLEKTRRGSQYRYSGGGFDAAILPDGRVRFRDKDGLMLTVMTTHEREFGPSGQTGPATAYGLNVGDARALWNRLRGKDPFAAERRLFLERTRELREYLARRAATGSAPPEDESSVDAEPPEPQLEPPARE